MNNAIPKLACKIGEGFQASSLVHTTKETNVFHRNVLTHESSDLSFMNGLVSTGLRGSVLLDGDKVIGNYDQLLSAARHHLALVVNTSARIVGQSRYSAINNYENINAVAHTGCFQFVANSPQEEIYLTLIAHRIAELSLVPGMVIADYDATEDEIQFPSDELIKKYLGNPDDQIESPTPAQEMIFGKRRRRIPNWFSLDLPVMLGSHKNEEALSFESAASEKYFYDHLPQLINQAFEEFFNVFGVDISPVVFRGKSTDYAIISVGAQISGLFDQIAKEKKKEYKKTGLLLIRQLQPFPHKVVSGLIKGKKAVTILESTTGPSPSFSSFYHNIFSSLKEHELGVYSAKYGTGTSKGTLEKAIQHMISKQPQTTYYLDVPFTKVSSKYPKHEILLHEIEKQYPAIQNQSIVANTSNDNSTSITGDEIPLALRIYKDQGPKYSRLARFYDHTAFFYQSGEPGELVADPFSALPVVPVSSAGFFSKASAREYLPILDTVKCTGCGDCFVQCPHSALPPIVLGVEDLLKTGAELAGSKGMIITRLTPMIKNLAKSADKIINDSDAIALQDLLPKVFESVAGQMNLEGEKLQTVRSEFNAVMDEVGSLTVAITEQFFKTPHSIEQGNGELFSLAVDPNACTGCSICAEVCEAGALNMELQGSENLTKTRDQFQLWEQLPDTSGETINRAYHDKKYSSLAAMLLSRNYYMAMTGSNQTEKDIPYKTLLHLITATVESVVQPKIVKELNQIDELIDSLTENVHQKLSKALPTDNLDDLSKSLKSAHGKKLTIGELVSQISTEKHGKLIDSADLERKTNLVDALKHLRSVLTEGPTGVGRSRFGILLAGMRSMEWARQYPANNFTSPSVIHWKGSAPDQTLGLFYGQLRFLLDNIKLMRRAVLESKDKYDASIHDLEIAELSWQALTEEEKQLVPPILLIAEKDDMGELGWNSLNKLLAEDYPLKVFLFDCVASPKNSPVASMAQSFAGLLSAMALKNGFIYQGGMGNIDHLFDGLLTGLDRSYPALYNLYTTKLEKHSVPGGDWSPLASLALDSRAFPSVIYDPRTRSNPENDFLSGTINLDGNKENRENWVVEEIVLSDDETIEYKISWADWAFTQTEWKDEFTPVKSNDSIVPVVDFIRLETKERKGQLPVITRANEQGLKHYAVSDQVVQMTIASLSNWNTLQEIAGLLTEFPQKLRTQITRELSVNYEQDAADLKNKFERQLKEQEAAQTEVLRQKLKEKLVELSKMAVARRKGAEKRRS